MTAGEELIHLRQENSQLREQLKQLTGEVKRLQEQLAKNSQNSPLLSSSDRLSRQKKGRSLREISKRKSGGQPGQTRQMSPEPDEKIMLAPVAHCEHCQADLSEVPAKTMECRQVIDS